ncbi:uracil-DNA glycosylase [Bacteroides bouchesdurhonensis]|uniref:uracil-DNA glycosylase n=1 Tax=Bacteroides bouchesdurhonensis TaxID=1841855 RepID=UPI00097F8AAB|nr:uracil-DNA glycosylase [Bacteroides bouchesdurhonensis]
MNVKIEESWRTHLQEEFDKPYFEKLVTFIRSEYGRTQVLPPGHQIFHVFNSCPFEKVKVVILGQDPYPNPGQYYGICFSVPDGVAIPGSLINIFREIQQDLGKPIPTSGNLNRWVEQGVFPMNSVLTVRAYATGSHRNMGWETFTDAVIKKLSDEREHLVFMLWGSYAKEKIALIDTNKHLVLTAAHPSPRSAEYGFLGCKHFSKANTFLQSKGIKEIDW